MKFLIIGDLHGKVPEFYYDDFDAIIAPGDFCSSEMREYVFEAIERQNDGEEIQWYDIPGKGEAKELIEESLEAGREVLETLNDKGVPVYLVPGNWDWTSQVEEDWEFLQRDHFEEKLIKGLDNVVNLDMWIADTDGFQIIGYGRSYGPEYPQSEEELEGLDLDELKKVKDDHDETFDKLASLFEQATKPVIFLTHNVPYDTPLDVVGMEESPRHGEHYGSVISKELVREYQPLVCIGSHIHEHYGQCEVGNTTVINSGFGSDKNTLLEVGNGRIKNLEFHQTE